MGTDICFDVNKIVKDHTDTTTLVTLALHEHIHHFGYHEDTAYGVTGMIGSQFFLMKIPLTSEGINQIPNGSVIHLTKNVTNDANTNWIVIQNHKAFSTNGFDLSTIAEHEDACGIQLRQTDSKTLHSGEFQISKINYYDNTGVPSNKMARLEAGEVDITVAGSADVVEITCAYKLTGEVGQNDLIERLKKALQSADMDLDMTPASAPRSSPLVIHEFYNSVIP
jgi:hypothetical protein